MTESLFQIRNSDARVTRCRIESRYDVASSLTPPPGAENIPRRSLFMPKRIITDVLARLFAATPTPSVPPSPSLSRKTLHDANNQLSIILGHADILAHNLDAGSEHERHVRAIIRATRDLARLLQR
jgi:hypothetical protein